MTNEVEQDHPLTIENIMERLPAYSDPGTLSPIELGIANARDYPDPFPIVSDSVLKSELAGSFIGKTHNINGVMYLQTRNDKLLPMVSFLTQAEVLEFFHDPTRATEPFNPLLISYVGLETSLMATGYTDLLRLFRLGQSYYLINKIHKNTTGVLLLERDLDDRGIIDLLEHYPGVDQLTGSTFYADMPWAVAKPNNGMLARNMARINQFFRVLAAGDQNSARETMRYYPYVAAYGAGLLLTFLKSGLFSDIFPGNADPKTVALTLAGAETAPVPNVIYDIPFASVHTLYSTCLDGVLDLAVRTQAPNAFAFINMSISDVLKTSDYISRMTVTRGTLDLNTLGLDKLNTKMNLGEYVTPVEVVPKSVFTTGAEVLNEHIEEFIGLLRDNGIDVPRQQIQLGWDFDALIALDRLIKVQEENNRSGNKDIGLESFLLTIYRKIQTTTDLLRGTVYLMFEKDLDDVIQSSIDREDLGKVLVLNYHNAEGSHPFIRIWRTAEDIAACALQLGLESTATPSQILDHWYRIHGGSEMPYGAVHLQGLVQYIPSVLQDVAPRSHMTEIRLSNVKHMWELNKSREPFKQSMSSGHIRI